jgi:hypothetical protein
MEEEIQKTIKRKEWWKDRLKTSSITKKLAVRNKEQNLILLFQEAKINNLLIPLYKKKKIMTIF